MLRPRAPPHPWGRLCWGAWLRTFSCARMGLGNRCIFLINRLILNTLFSQQRGLAHILLRCSTPPAALLAPRVRSLQKTQGAWAVLGQITLTPFELAEPLAVPSRESRGAAALASFWGFAFLAVSAGVLAGPLLGPVARGLGLTPDEPRMTAPGARASPLH